MRQPLRLSHLASVLIAAVCSVPANAQSRKAKPTPKPNPLVAEHQLLKLTGEITETQFSRDVKILWLSGPEDHGGGEHDYIRVKEMFVPMLKTIPRVSVDEAFQFPSQKQFDQADLLIQFLHMPDLTDQQLSMYRGFVERGGGVVSIHESCIMRPLGRADKYAKCIGCSWQGNDTSKWSKFDRSYRLFLNTRNPIFAGLPNHLSFNDESYWNLLSNGNATSIAAVAPEELEGQPFANVIQDERSRPDAFWTYTSGKGRVFGTTTGHYTYTYSDPHYRLLLLRGIAWALKEAPTPLMPLVYQGITNDDGLVGTTDTMMDYTNRKK